MTERYSLYARGMSIISDDAAIKVIFDHVRNVVLCALLAGAAEFILARPEHFGPPWLMSFGGVMVGAVGGTLTILNAWHGLNKARVIPNEGERLIVMLAINIFGPLTYLAVLVGRPFVQANL